LVSFKSAGAAAGAVGFGKADFGAVDFSTVDFAVLDFEVFDLGVVGPPEGLFTTLVLGAAGFLAEGLCGLVASFADRVVSGFLPPSGVWAFCTVQTYQSDIKPMSEYHKYTTSPQNRGSSRQARLA
jgi:hypothetical protein